jgi:hypothetical protein
MSRFIEGEDRNQATLLPEYLDDYLAEDNPVRAVDAFVEELDLKQLGFAGADPAPTGRPAYHPAVLLKLYTYGYVNRIASGPKPDCRHPPSPTAAARLVSAADIAEGTARRSITSRMVLRELGRAGRRRGRFQGSRRPVSNAMSPHGPRAVIQSRVARGPASAGRSAVRAAR